MLQENHQQTRQKHPSGQQAKAFINGTDRCAHHAVPISGTRALHLAKTTVKGSEGLGRRCQDLPPRRIEWVPSSRFPTAFSSGDKLVDG